jgi:RHS repeat-associated protein
LHDALDRVVSIDFPGALAVRYAYDSAGNRASVRYPDGKFVKYTYDADNRVSRISDWLSQITSYSYDSAGNLTGIAYPNKVTSVLSYDAAKRLSGKVDSNGSAFRTLSYVLDKAGNRITVTDNSISTDYTYDNLNHLLSSATAGASTSWTYDAAGNRLTQTAPSAVVTTYTYDSADRMLTAGASTFTYDKNGNQLTATTSSGTTTNAYDSANRLLTSSGPNGTSNFTYDGDGNRFTQTTLAGTYTYANDTAAALPVVLNESGPDGTIDYAYGLGLTESSSAVFNYFYNLDGLGSVFNLTDTTGTVQETYSYDAWGNPLNASGSVGTQNKFRFTGQALDPATGLYFLRARYYATGVGRFISKDPIGLAGGTNFYRYAAGNPIVNTDPYGLWTLQVGGIGNFQFGPINLNGSDGVVFDSKGNLGEYTTVGLGGGFGADEFFGIIIEKSNGDCIQDIGGPFEYTSVSVGGGLGGGVDAFAGQGSHGQPVLGRGISLGQGQGADFSIGGSTTTVTPIW